MSCPVYRTFVRSFEFTRTLITSMKASWQKLKINYKASEFYGK